MGHLIVTRASIHGFLAFDWWHRRDEALQRLSNWQRAGQIRFKEDVLDGIECLLLREDSHHPILS
jgi:NADPH-dependent curcumin reductase CurA